MEGLFSKEEKTLTVCKAMESANNNMRDLQGSLMETGQNEKSLKGEYSAEKKALCVTDAKNNMRQRNIRF